MIVADTGVLYALVDRSDAWHTRVVEWWKRNDRDIVVPITTLPEVTYLLQRRIGVAAEYAFVAGIADGEMQVEPIESEDYPRITELMRAYEDLPLGFVDASVIAVAERLDARDVLTTDRRHFGGVRPSHVRALTLLP